MDRDFDGSRFAADKEKFYNISEVSYYNLM